MSVRVSRLVVAASFALIATLASAFDLEGHRGARGLAPENTLAAFKRALAIGVTTIETDLAVTRDDVLVISHDPFLNPDLVRGPDGQVVQREVPRAAGGHDAVRLDPGDGPSPTDFTLSLSSVSIVRHAVAISGARFFTSTSVRQSNDCTVTRSAIPLFRTVSTTRRANVCGSTV